MVFLFPGKAIALYNVSGVVEFTSRRYDTLRGGVRTSDQTFAQLYQASMSGPILDPRFMNFTVGAGYNVLSNKNGQDSTSLNYNISTVFFPAMKVSWSLYGSKSSNTVQNNASLAGYDLTTTNYGGDLFLRLSRMGGGNNNNNNNNFTNRAGLNIPLPDIVLSRSHTETDSPSSVNPISETRDNTRASISYRYGAKQDLTLDGSMENYKNLIDGSSYDIKTAFLNWHMQVSPGGDLKLDGRMTDRATQNIANYETSQKNHDYNALLSFQEKDRFAHYYRYNFSQQNVNSQDVTAQRAEAKISYRIIDELQLRGGLDYSLVDRMVKATVTTPEQSNRVETGGVTAGVSYSKLYTPQFLGPFGFKTGYDFISGFSKVSGQMVGQSEGSGRYYGNTLSLGLMSIGWKDETASLDYTYSNRRDDSPANNISEQQIVRLNLSTKRLPRTTIVASGSYMVNEYSVGFTNQLIAGVENSAVQNRTVNYSINAVHAATSYVNLLAGASRGTSSSVSTSTLSSLPPNSATTDDTLYYASANLNYMITRNMLYQAELREEVRSTKTTDSNVHLLNMSLLYRIRSIFINLECKWRQDAPDNDLRTTQTSYLAKLSRPF